jgi:L-iditol 2-dehydrogenase
MSPSAAAVTGSGPVMRTQVLVKPGCVELAELPRPQAGPGEIVLRVRAALTCGTDVKAFIRGHPKFPMPTPFGHEFAGEVAEVGKGAQGFREGDAIMTTPSAPCGACYLCRHGDENLCDAIMADYVLGGYGEYVRLPARLVQRNTFQKPPALDFSEAALLEPLSCVAHGLTMVPLRPDDTVAIIGAGAIGLLHLMALHASGIENVIVVGRGEERVARARRLGARTAVAGGVDGAREIVLASTEGRGADVVIECTGQVAVWEAAPSLARKGGFVVLFGGCPGGSTATFDTARLHYDQIRLISPFHFTTRAVRRAFELLASGTIDGRQLLSGEFSLEALVDALNRHERGDGIKYVIRP